VGIHNSLHRSNRKKSNIACLSTAGKALSFSITAFVSEGGYLSSSSPDLSSSPSGEA
jgi:hypothetical protein